MTTAQQRKQLLLPLLFAGFAVLGTHSPILDTGLDVQVRPAPMTDAAIQAAADRLLEEITKPGTDNQYFPRFARQQLDWIVRKVRQRRLSIILLKDVSNTNLDAGALMGAGTVRGRQAIIIAQPRLERLLRSMDPSGPSSRVKQKNDFMLGLVHEVVHLRNANAGDPGNPADRLGEELRAWHEVDIHVVRPLRKLHQPMDPTFLKVDDALLACSDRRMCPAVRHIIFPGDGSR